MSMLSNVKLSEILYYVFFLLLFTTRILGLYEGNVVYSSILVISLICFIISYLMTPTTVVAYCFDFILLFLALISWRLSGEKGLLLFFSMMIGVRRISIDRLFKIVLTISGTAYSIMIMLGALGFINEYQNLLSYRVIVGYINRRTISPLQINIVMEPYLVLMVLALYLIRNKGKKITLIVSGSLFLGVLYLFGYCFAYSSLLISILILTSNYYLKFYNSFSKITDIFSHLIYLFFIIISIVGSYLEDSVYGSGGTLQRRFQIGHYYLQYYSPTLFGQRIINPDPKYMAYDIHQSQLHLYLYYGIVLFVVVNLLHHIAIQCFVKWRDATALSTTLSFSALGVVEPLLFNLSFKNIVFVFVGKAYGEMLDRISTKHRILGRNIQVIPDKEFIIKKSIPIYLANKFDFLLKNPIRVKKSIVFAMIVGCVAAGVAAVKIPEKAYMFDQSERSSVDGIEYYFSPSEIHDLDEQGIPLFGDRENGGIFYKRVNYAPVYDYIRLIVSSFIWTTIWLFIFLVLLSKSDKDCYHIGNNNT